MATPTTTLVVEEPEVNEPTYYTYHVDREKSKASHQKYYKTNKEVINDKRKTKYHELDAEVKAERSRVSQLKRKSRLAAAAELKEPKLVEEKVQCECKKFLYPSNMPKHVLTKTHLAKML